jgi:hypothetical protein
MTMATSRQNRNMTQSVESDESHQVTEHIHNSTSHLDILLEQLARSEGMYVTVTVSLYHSESVINNYYVTGFK